MGALSRGMPNVAEDPFNRLQKANTRLRKDKNSLADQLKIAKSNSSDTIIQLQRRVAELEQGERNIQRRLQTAREEGAAGALDEAMDDGEGPQDPEEGLPKFEAPRSFASGEPPSADAISSRGTRLCQVAARAWDNIARVTPMSPAQIAAVLGVPVADVDVGKWYEDEAFV